MPHRDGVDKADSCDVYGLTAQTDLSDLIGKLLVDWGPGTLAWVQYASRHNKPVLELRREFKEPDFPGFMTFIQPLSRLPRLPNTWVAALMSARGVYLLTCPRTREQYVGSACGADGFWGRWQAYLTPSQGGNVGLLSRDPSDYQVSILEVAGSSADDKAILQMEGRWQLRLQSREMGLNRNLASRLHP